MKRISLLAVAVAMASPAFAADIVVDQPAEEAPAIENLGTGYDWTGIYVGAQAGAAIHQGGSAIDPGGDDVGFVGGGHVGGDYQFGNTVIGAVADINYIDADANRRFDRGEGEYLTLNGVALDEEGFGDALALNGVSAFDVDGFLDRSGFYGSNGFDGPNGFDTDRFGIREDVNFMGTVRGRLGYSFNGLLVYGTGGLAYADFDSKNGIEGTYTDPASGYAVNVDVDGERHGIDFGYTVGAGLDYLILPNVSVGAEYLYTDLGKKDYSVTVSDNLGNVATADFDGKRYDMHSIMAKASYRFN